MPAVELLYDADCPNVNRAREQLFRAFAKAGLEARWREWHADDTEAPAYVRGFGSPTILVDGMDVAGAEPGEGTQSCRLYGHPGDERRGAPSVDTIVVALMQKRRSQWQRRERSRCLPRAAPPARRPSTS